MNEEAETIRKAISQLTRAEYEFQEPSHDFPPSTDKVAWVLVSPIPLQERTPAIAPIIWEDESGVLSVESLDLGSTSEWIYEMYGERGAKRSLAMEPEFSTSDIREVLKRHFSRIHKRLLQYESILARVSSKQGIELQLECNRNQFIVTFYALAKIDAKGLDTQTKIEKVKLSIEAIREVLDRIEKLDAELAKRT